MGIQDLGAIGEFVSSIVIVATLVVLIYEVRGTKTATLRGNTQDRQSKRDNLARSLAESPDLAQIIETANQHLGLSRSEIAAEFGLGADQYRRLDALFMRMLLQWRDAFLLDLPEKEKAALAMNIRLFFSEPAGAKWYDLRRAEYRGAELGSFFDHLDQIRASSATGV